MKSWLSFLLCICVLFSQLLSGGFAQVVQAAPPGVEFFRDTINDNSPGHPQVAHDIYFVLPVNTQQISPNDFILLEFTNFYNVTAPNSVSGGYGNANLSVSGNKVTITNIALLPGTGMQVFGIIAGNPPTGQSFSVTLKVAEDAAGTIVRNQSTTVANPSGNQLSVSATVETILSAVNISGFSSPSAFVSLTEGVGVVGTTSADGTGFFSFPMSGLSTGEHTYTIFSTDTASLSTSQSSLQLFLLPGTLTNASGILLSPSISISTREINPGDTLTVSGSGKPSSQINIFVESPLKSYSTTTNSQGLWTYTIASSETTNYSPGQYRIYTNIQDSIGNQSIVSPTLSFIVKSAENSTNPPPSCDISKGDLNCDSNTNLVDFSILLFHWRTNHRVADINADGTVNLTDFSIMMFYFRR